jgi:20S proteasome subunit alpha 4
MRQSRSRIATSSAGILSWLWLAVIVLLCTTFSISQVEAAHSRRRGGGGGGAGGRGSGSARYDRSITTFDRSGRLLQVEYGMEAAVRGETIMAVWTEKGIYVLVKSQTSSSKSQSSKSSSLSSHKVHRIDEHLWLFTAGLSGDASALASSLRSSCQQHRLSYGEASTVEQAARQAASLQHQLTRTGGARPLGCTAIVVGIDPTASVSTSASGGVSATGKARIFRSDPGGILEDCLYSVAGKDNEKLMMEMGKRYNGDFSKTANETTVVTEMMSAVFSSSSLVSSGSSDDDETLVDIWIFQPNSKRRGKTHATCFRNVKPSNLQSVVALLDKREKNI